MSSIVTDIRTALESQVSTILGVTWKANVNKFSPDKTNKATREKRFGVIVGSADFADGPLGFNTFDRVYQVTLQDSYALEKDSARQTVLDDLEDQASEIIKVITNNKLGLPSVILNIIPSPIEQPDLETENLAIMRIDFNIMYREAIT